MSALRRLATAGKESSSGVTSGTFWQKLRAGRQRAVDTEKQAVHFEQLTDLLKGVWCCPSCLQRNWRESKTCQQCRRPRPSGRAAMEMRANAAIRGLPPTPGSVLNDVEKQVLSVENTAERCLMDSLPSGGFVPCREKDEAPARAIVLRGAKRAAKKAGARMYHLHIPDEDRGVEYGLVTDAATAASRKARCSKCRFGGEDAAEAGLRPSTHTCRQALSHVGEDWMNAHVRALAAAPVAHARSASWMDASDKPRRLTYHNSGDFGPEEANVYGPGPSALTFGSLGGELTAASVHTGSAPTGSGTAAPTRRSKLHNKAEQQARGPKKTKMEGQTTESRIIRQMTQLQRYGYPMTSQRARAEERMAYYRDTMQLPQECRRTY